jgi:fatty-acyl-CoA synthase
MTEPPLTPYATPGAALRDQAARRPDAPALVFPESGGRLRFSGWLAAAEAAARGLLDLGLAPGAHLALLAENRLEWPIAQLAGALGGFVLVPLNTHYRRDDLAYALAQSDSAALLLSPAFRSNPYLETLRALRPSLPRLAHAVVFGGSQPDCPSFAELIAAGARSTTPLPPVQPGDAAALLYTSGTTGFPKGALLTHDGMLANAWGTTGRLGVVAGDRWTSIIPLFHCAGCILNLLGCLQRGATYVGVPAFDPVAMFRIIEAERCTHLTGVPTSYLAMLEHPERARFDLTSLRAGTCGGADTDAAMLARCAESFPMPRVAQVYGQTEVSTLVSCPALDDDDRFAAAGAPLPGVAVRITDPRSGVPLATGEIGQVEARGAMVMRGYYNKPEATAEVLVDGWLKTGDLGRLTPDGRLVIAGGRLRDMIIRGGENIYPAEIEALLLSHPAVAEVAVFGVPDTYYGEAVAAAIRLAAPASAADLQAHCHGRIARFKLPSVLYRLAEFPLTASGKIRKTELRSRAAAGELATLE